MNKSGPSSNPVKHPPNPMKTTVLSLLAVVSVFGTLTPGTARAVPPVLPMGVQPYPGERRIVSYLTNGTPVWAVYQAVGYDGMGYPIYQWVTLPSTTYVRPWYGGYAYGYRSYHSYRAPVYVRPHYMTPHVGGHVSPPMHFGGSVHHSGGSFHMGHSGGGHASHGGGHGGGHHR